MVAQQKDDEGKDLADNPRQSTLEQYRSLLDKQEEERKLLLSQIDELISQFEGGEVASEKMREVLKLVQELKNQILPPSEIEEREREVQVHTSTTIPENIDEQRLSTEIQVLYDLLESKREEVDEKDMTIMELNKELEIITSEKKQLIEQLERLNQITESRKNQLFMLEKMAEEDPKYKIIEALKSHDKLTEIQLAFALGTSITQVRRFIMDLKDMGLISSERDGRLKWLGS